MAAGGRALETPEARARINRQLQEQIERIPDQRPPLPLPGGLPPQRLRLPWQGRREGSPPAFVSPEPPVRRGGALGPGAHGTAQPRERTLLQTLLDYPELLVEQREAVAGFPFRTRRFVGFAEALVDWAEAGHDPEGTRLRDHLVERGHGGVVAELTESDTYYLDRTPSLDGARILFEDILKRQRQWLEEQAAQSEAEGAHTDAESWELYRERILRLQEAAEAEATIPDYDGAPRASGA